MEINFKSIVEESYDFNINKEALISLLNKVVSELYYEKEGYFYVDRNDIYETIDCAIAFYTAPNGNKYIYDNLTFTTTKMDLNSKRIHIFGKRKIYPEFAYQASLLLDDNISSEELLKVLYYLGQYKYYKEISEVENIFDKDLLNKYYEELMDILNNSLEKKSEIKYINKIGKMLRPEGV